MSELALLGDRYALGGLLGRGGMATVRHAVDTRLGRPVAVKQLVAHLAADPVCQARFRREARSAASLNHPSIVAVFDTGEQSEPVTGVSVPYLVMELVDGQTLRAVLTEQAKILPSRALELTCGVLAALSHSHEAGIVHRDIKPANVMVTSTGEVKVMDFGIARAVADTSTDFTQTTSVVGTAHYLSPEQARGEKVSFSSDLYSAGCLMYELLTGRPPFVGESVLSVIYQHVREAPVPPSHHEPGLSSAVDAVVLKSLAKEPAERYASAREMAADLELLLAGREPVAAAVLTPTPRSVEPADEEAGAAVADGVAEEVRQRHARRGLAIMTVLVLVLVLLGVGAYSNHRSVASGAVVPPLAHVSLLAGRPAPSAQQPSSGVRPRRTLHVSTPRGRAPERTLQQSPLRGAAVRRSSAAVATAGPPRTAISTGLTRQTHATGGRHQRQVRGANTAGKRTTRHASGRSTSPSRPTPTSRPSPLRPSGPTTAETSQPSAPSTTSSTTKTGPAQSSGTPDSAAPQPQQTKAALSKPVQVSSQPQDRKTRAPKEQHAAPGGEQRHPKRGEHATRPRSDTKHQHARQS